MPRIEEKTPKEEKLPKEEPKEKIPKEEKDIQKVEEIPRGEEQILMIEEILEKVDGDDIYGVHTLEQVGLEGDKKLWKNKNRHSQI